MGVYCFPERQAVAVAKPNWCDYKVGKD